MHVLYVVYIIVNIRFKSETAQVVCLSLCALASVRTDTAASALSGWFGYTIPSSTVDTHTSTEHCHSTRLFTMFNGR